MLAETHVGVGVVVVAAELSTFYVVMASTYNLYLYFSPLSITQSI